MKSHYQNIISAMTVQDKVQLLNGKGLWRSAALPHLGIDDMVMTDGTYGVRYSESQIERGESWSFNDFIAVVQQDAAQASPEPEQAVGGSEALFSKSRPATCFPNGSTLACSWDLALIYQMGQALAEECQEMGVDILLGPGINIRRTPLAGRGYEYYAEDPLLSGDIAAALINGLQDHGVGSSLKHFACNNSEYMRTEMDSIVDERALHEIYLAGFERAIQRSDPWTLMSSYNRLNGEQTSQHYDLLTRILRQQWGYQGLVMSDWYGIKDRPASLLAGNDLEMPENESNNRALLAAIENGEIPQPLLDAACERMLALIARVQAGRRPGARADYAAHHRLAQQIAAESLVLLKNEDQILPLRPQHSQRIAVLGRPAQVPVIQGSGCATTVPWMLDLPLDEIVALGSEQHSIHYAPGTDEQDGLTAESRAEAQAVAREADVAVVFVSTAVGEDGENGDRKDLGILPGHEALIHAIADVQPNLVVVVANSDAVVMPWLERTKAVLETFYAGQGMGKAVAQALFGKINPSGKLTVTFPQRLEDTPAFLHYPGENLRHHYAEGIYVGYRYYERKQLAPLFPFGFGLSYTCFDYANLQLARSRLREGEQLEVSVAITNSGGCTGKEVVQLYIRPPASRLPRPPQELKAFGKLELQPGETGTLHFTLNQRDFSYYDPLLQQWVAESGDYQICIGKSSQDIVLQQTVTLEMPALYPPVSWDSSLVQIVKHPYAFAAVTALVAEKSGLTQEVVEAKLQKIAPDMFCGLYTTLTEMLELEVDKVQLQQLLEQANQRGLQAG